MSLASRITEDLSASGLSLAQLKEHVRPVKPEDLKKIFKDTAKFRIDAAVSAEPLEGALEYNYYIINDDGEVVPAGYCRYKLYWGALKGFAAKAEDGRAKYLQKSSTLTHLYVPPNIDWAPILDDPAQPICITEGEKKALALCERGVPCVGLGGVDSIGNRKRGQSILPELKQLCTGDRPILVVFDIDQGYTCMKPQVARAANTLAQQILEYGGVPKVVTLPSNGKQKCAVDDWLKTHVLRDSTLRDTLIEHAKTLDSAIALYEEAEKYIYISDSNCLANVVTREPVLIMDYRVSSGNKQIVVQEVVMKRGAKGQLPTQGTELCVRTLSDAFLRWGSRPTARSTVYKPGVHHHLTADGSFNQWKGWAQGEAAEVSEEDVAPLWSAFVKLYREDALVMWNWFMYPIAKPGAKWVMIPVIQATKEGIGKSSIPEFFCKFVYGEGAEGPNNATTLNAMSLRDGRLEFMVRKQFLFLDDANDLHGNDVEALIKNLATTSSVRANPKYLRSYDCPNIINLAITTNRTMPFKVPTTDRRLFFPYTAVDVPKSVWHELHEWGRKGGGAKVVAYARKLFDVEACDPFMAAPMTEKKEQVIGIARHPFERFIVGLATAANNGELGRVVFSAPELRAMAKLDGSVKDEFDVHSHLLHRAVELAGGMAFQGGKPVRVGNATCAFYILSSSEAEAWQERRPLELVKEMEKYPLERLWLKPQRGKVVPISKARS